MITEFDRIIIIDRLAVSKAFLDRFTSSGSEAWTWVGREENLAKVDPARNIVVLLDEKSSWISREDGYQDECKATFFSIFAIL